MVRYRRKIPAFAVSLLLLLGASIGCGTSPSRMTTPEVVMAPLKDMPAEVKSATAQIQQAYQFAVANPDVLKGVPCYCGCRSSGHTNNYVCYVKDSDAAGKVTFDLHAVGCTICVDITRDAIRYYKQGRTVQQIRIAIDMAYAQYGQSNMLQ